MKSYSSFLLRCWVIREESEKIIFDVEQIQTGERQRATTPEDALQWILAVCQNYQPEQPDVELDVPSRPTSQTGPQ